MNSKNADVSSVIADTFITTFKICVVLYIATMCALAVASYKPSASRVGDARVEINQTGNGNIQQEIKNN